jgi:hypothetical protein
MKTNRIVTSHNISQQSSTKALPNSEMLSRQIENLRIVMRRMKNNKSSTLNSLINQKLKDLQ